MHKVKQHKGVAVAAAVCAVALHRCDELLPRLLLVLGDDVQQVLFPAASYADVDACGAGGISEDRV